MRYAFGIMRPGFMALAFLSCCFAGASRTEAQSVPTGFVNQSVAAGLDFPVALEFVPDALGHVRLLVVQQFDSRIRLVRDGAVLGDVMTVPAVAVGEERGLLGVALDPGFPARPYLYVHCDDASGSSIRISRFTLSGDLLGAGTGVLTADPASRFDLIADVPDLFGNHNGGTVRFGPDGRLYASFGEDADPCGAQDSTRLKGVILRLDVNRIPSGPGAATRAMVTPGDNPFAASPDSNARLVAAFGLRNPFRFQIDPVRRWLVIADVGQGAVEELDLLRIGPGPAPGSAPLGADFGWPWFEGNNAFSTCPNGNSAGLAGPIATYGHSAGSGAAIISAGAYHAVTGAASNWPAMYEGDLFFSDYYTGMLRRLQQGAGSWSAGAPVEGQPNPSDWGTGFSSVSDYRMGPDGGLWYVRQSVNYQSGTGSVGRIVYDLNSPPPTPTAAFVVRVFASHPQPAVGSVTLDIELSEASPVHLSVFDARGRRVRTLLDRVAVSSGYQGVSWDGRDDDGHRVSAGRYFAQLEARGILRRHTITLLR
ncbi:MAG: PQQ-dependent sugar dehydrogenase [Candidatus Eisenbacteria bacterium]